MTQAKPKTAKSRIVSKFQSYRRNKKKQGMKLIRLWVPDPKAPGFKNEVCRQMTLLRKAPEEAEALRFIEVAADWPSR